MTGSSKSPDRLRSLLTQCSHHDKDERYMAISDLKSEIESQPLLESSLQLSIRSAMFARLEDSSSDVQAIAVNCLCSIVQKFNADQVIELVGSIGGLARTKTDPGPREVYSEALRSIVEYVPRGVGKQVFDLLFPSIFEAMGSGTYIGHDQEARANERTLTLRLLQSLLERFDRGSIGEENCLRILPILIKEINQDRNFSDSVVPSVVGSFSGVCSPAVLSQLVLYIVKQLSAPSSGVSPAMIVFTLACIARRSGRRIVQYSSDIIRVLNNVAGLRTTPDLSDTEEDIVAVRQHALTVIQTLIRVGPRFILPQANMVIELSLSLMSLDPNFVETQCDDDGMDDYENDDWGLESDSLAQDDAGDTTWKVRLAALKLVSTFIECDEFANIIRPLFISLIDSLQSRFIERETSVQVQVFQTFTSLITIIPELDSQGENEQNLCKATSSRMTTILQHLRPYIVTSIAQTRLAAHAVVNQLVHTLNGSIVQYFPTIFDCVVEAIGDKDDAAIQLLSLDSIQAMINNMSQEDIVQMGLKRVIDALTESANHEKSHAISKVCAKSFESLSVLFVRMRSSRTSLVYYESSLFSPVYNTMLQAVRTQQESAQSDAHRAASLALAEYLACFGHYLDSNEVLSSIDLMLESTRSRLTESSGLQFLQTVGESSIINSVLAPHAQYIFISIVNILESKAKQSFSTIISYMSVLGTYLDHFENMLTVQALSQCLNALFPFGHSPDATVFPSVHVVSAKLLHALSQRGDKLPMSVMSPLVNQCVSALKVADSLPQSALAAINGVLCGIVSLSNVDEYVSLINILESLPFQQPLLHQTALAPLGHAIADCMIAHSYPDQESLLFASINEFFDRIRPDASSVSLQLVLTIIGDIGNKFALPETLLQHLFSVILSLCMHENESVRNAAAYALGNCIANNANIMILPIVEHMCQNQPQILYFLLHSLKEFFMCPSISDISEQHINFVVPKFLEYAGSDNEGVRQITAECLGKLLVLSPALMISFVENRLRSSSPLIRTTVVTAVKFSYGQRQSGESVSVNSIIPLMTDSNIGVKRQVFLALTAAVQNKSQAFKEGHLLEESIIPCAINASKVNVDLIRKVDFGAFQEIVDDGLLLRQVAYSCLKTVVEHYPGRIPVGSTIVQLADRVATDPDLDLQCTAYQLMTSLAELVPPGLQVDFLEQLPSLLLPSVKTKLAQIRRNPQDTDARKLLAAFIVTVHALHNLNGAESECPKFHVFYQQVLKTALLSEFLKEHQQEPPI
uniref:TATA-binding protein interacting (TIP20) domain-containing protein n=1 Tax=Spongospora subterranea TaxID=70186 RepID=A0A0H5QW21_9EUKA|eukprot:CRZ05796.1 hypothetical protein [Spongospora subterranea]